jgi:hypothetical protein
MYWPDSREIRKWTGVDDKRTLENFRKAYETFPDIRFIARTPLIPGVNDMEIPDIAKRASELGAYTFNVIPLIPQYKFAGITPPTPAEKRKMQDECSKYLRQMRHCQRCRPLPDISYISEHHSIGSHWRLHQLVKAFSGHRGHGHDRRRSEGRPLDQLLNVHLDQVEPLLVDQCSPLPPIAMLGPSRQICLSSSGADTWSRIRYNI